MPVKDLPYTAVPGFTGKIGDFIQVVEGADQHVSKIVLNPAASETKEVSDPSTARVFIDAAIGLPFDWKLLRKGLHCRTDIRSNKGFTKNVGRILAQGVYWRADALNSNAMPTATPTGSDPRFGQSNMDEALAMDDILSYQVVIDLDQVDESARQSLKPFADFLSTVLNAQDIPAAQEIRKKAREEKAERAIAWRNASNVANSPAFKKPNQLMAVVDGVPIDLYMLPTGVRLYRMKADGVIPSKSTCMWDASDLAIAWVQAAVSNNLSLGTEQALKAASKIY